jgi:hypothetical protein
LIRYQLIEWPVATECGRSIPRRAKRERSLPRGPLPGLRHAPDSGSEHYPPAEGNAHPRTGTLHALQGLLASSRLPGTVTADFNRWAKTPSDSLIATFSAFPFANLAMLVGGVMTAALAVPDANPFGADNMFGYMNGKQIAWLTLLAFLFLYCNLGSVCSHCLYNSATGGLRLYSKNRFSST